MTREVLLAGLRHSPHKDPAGPPTAATAGGDLQRPAAAAGAAQGFRTLAATDALATPPLPLP